MRVALKLDDDSEVAERDLAPGALALAAELGAWGGDGGPAKLVRVAADFGLWQAAEDVCKAARRLQDPETDDAARALVDAASARGLYRPGWHQKGGLHCPFSPWEESEKPGQHLESLGRPRPWARDSRDGRLNSREER